MLKNKRKIKLSIALFFLCMTLCSVSSGAEGFNKLCQERVKPAIVGRYFTEKCAGELEEVPSFTNAGLLRECIKFKMGLPTEPAGLEFEENKISEIFAKFADKLPTEVLFAATARPEERRVLSRAALSEIFDQIPWINDGDLALLCQDRIVIKNPQLGELYDELSNELLRKLKTVWLRSEEPERSPEGKPEARPLDEKSGEQSLVETPGASSKEPGQLGSEEAIFDQIRKLRALISMVIKWFDPEFYPELDRGESAMQELRSKLESVPKLINSGLVEEGKLDPLFVCYATATEPNLVYALLTAPESPLIKQPHPVGLPEIALMIEAIMHERPYPGIFGDTCPKGLINMDMLIALQRILMDCMETTPFKAHTFLHHWEQYLEEWKQSLLKNQAGSLPKADIPRTHILEALIDAGHPELFSALEPVKGDSIKAEVLQRLIRILNGELQRGEEGDEFTRAFLDTIGYNPKRITENTNPFQKYAHLLESLMKNAPAAPTAPAAPVITYEEEINLFEQQAKIDELWNKKVIENKEFSSKLNPNSGIQNGLEFKNKYDEALNALKANATKGEVGLPFVQIDTGALFGCLDGFPSRKHSFLVLYDAIIKEASHYNYPGKDVIDYLRDKEMLFTLVEALNRVKSATNDIQRRYLRVDDDGNVSPIGEMIEKPTEVVKSGLVAESDRVNRELWPNLVERINKLIPNKGPEFRKACEDFIRRMEDEVKRMEDPNNDWARLQIKFEDLYNLFEVIPECAFSPSGYTNPTRIFHLLAGDFIPRNYYDKKLKEVCDLLKEWGALFILVELYNRVRPPFKHALVIADEKVVPVREGDHEVNSDHEEAPRMGDVPTTVAAQSSSSGTIGFRGDGGVRGMTLAPDNETSAEIEEKKMERMSGTVVGFANPQASGTVVDLNMPGMTRQARTLAPGGTYSSHGAGSSTKDSSRSKPTSDDLTDREAAEAMEAALRKLHQTGWNFDSDTEDNPIHGSGPKSSTSQGSGMILREGTLVQKESKPQEPQVEKPLESNEPETKGNVAENARAARLARFEMGPEKGGKSNLAVNKPEAGPNLAELATAQPATQENATSGTPTVSTLPTDSLEETSGETLARLMDAIKRKRILRLSLEKAVNPLANKFTLSSKFSEEDREKVRNMLNLAYCLVMNEDQQQLERTREIILKEFDNGKKNIVQVIVFYIGVEIFDTGKKMICDHSFRFQSKNPIDGRILGILRGILAEHYKQVFAQSISKCVESMKNEMIDDFKKLDHKGTSDAEYAQRVMSFVVQVDGIKRQADHYLDQSLPDEYLALFADNDFISLYLQDLLVSAGLRGIDETYIQKYHDELAAKVNDAKRAYFEGQKAFWENFNLKPITS